jgi:hypothetical protein
MALLSATSPAKAHFSAPFLCHEEPQHAHAVPAAAHPQQRCLGRRARARGRCAAAMRAPDAAIAQAPATGRKPRVLVAGGGIGGLVFALAARRKGYDVTVFERDLSAVRGEGQYRGPIQIQSNALAALEAIDMAVAEEVMRVGCVTGDRINGLVDGISGSWCVTSTVSLIHLSCLLCSPCSPRFYPRTSVPPPPYFTCRSQKCTGDLGYGTSKLCGGYQMIIREPDLTLVDHTTLFIV